MFNIDLLMDPVLNFQLQFEHKLLVVLYLLSYLGAMLIQIKDPKVTVEFSDWVLALITSFVGGMIMYFGVMSWANVGVRMGVTILATLVSYRTFKFIVSSESQEDFAKGFWKGIMGALRRLLNSNYNSDNDK